MLDRERLAPLSDTHPVTSRVEDAPSSTSESGVRSVVLVWLLVGAVTVWPYLRASRDPPPGTTFVGAFYFIDDFYNYFSYVQQASEGAFLFRNKLAPETHDAALVNVEWWAVGQLSAALGHRPVLAYRLFGLAAALALLFAVHRWLAVAGVPLTHRLAALVLVAFGAGLGGLAFLLLGWPAAACLDLSTGMFPFVEMLANPHFTTGTALLAWALWFFAAPGGTPVAIALGGLLGLVRPYDFVLLVGSRAAAIATTVPWRQWPARMIPLVALAPVAVYDYVVFYRLPAYAALGAAQYVAPSLEELGCALAPAAVGALSGLRRRAPDDRARSARAHLWAWVAVAGAVVVLRPAGYALQFAVGIGLPLLVLTSAALVRRRPMATLALTAALSTTAATALVIVTSPAAHWFVPAERVAAARTLRPHCREGELFLSPPDLGLYASAFTACRAYVSHAVSPTFAQRVPDVRRLYSPESPAEERAAILARICPDHVAVPEREAAAPAPGGWALALRGYRRVAVAGSADRGIALYSREGPCGR